jgi:hypothetical protein
MSSMVDGRVRSEIILGKRYKNNATVAPVLLAVLHRFLSACFVRLVAADVPDTIRPKTQTQLPRSVRTYREATGSLGRWRERNGLL